MCLTSPGEGSRGWPGSGRDARRTRYRRGRPRSGVRSAPSPGQVDEVLRARRVITTSGYRAASCAIGPPARVREPARVCGWPTATSSIGSAERRVRRRRTAPPGPFGDDARHDPHVADRDRLGAGVAQLVEQQLEGVARQGPGDRHPDPGTGHARTAPDQPSTRLRSARTWTAEVSPRCDGRGHRGRAGARASAISSRSWLLRVVTLATSSVSSWTDRPLRPWSAACESQLDDDQEPEHEQDGRDRDAARAPAHQGAAEGASRGDGAATRHAP